MIKIRRKTLWLICTFVCILSAGGLYIYHSITEKYGAFSDKQEEPYYLFIDQDDNIDSVYAKLHVIASEKGMTCFKKLAAKENYAQSIRTGRYKIEPGKRIIDVYRQLKFHRQEPLMVTVPETRTMPRMAALLSRKIMIDSATIAHALTDTAVCASYGYNLQTLPALFIPNTYEVYWDITLEDLMKRMVKENQNFWNAERMAKAEALGLTPVEVCTLASIVDEETANNDEKPMVAGLYLNRLRKGMLLQADPTVKFAMQDFSLRRILNKHLTTDSPYNTYKYAGLPPGPIKVASIQGIDAVLNATKHDYLYMCAKEDFSGTHNFAVTMREHMQNARRYQQALNKRGIKG